jgi:superfamily II DNA/RNA helicase
MMLIFLVLVTCASLFGSASCFRPPRLLSRRALARESLIFSTVTSEDKPVSFFSKKQFEELGYSKQLIEVTRSLGIDVPSKIQAISAYGVSTGKPCIIADQTGSGKTLGYLLPTIRGRGGEHAGQAAAAAG